MQGPSMANYWAGQIETLTYVARATREEWIDNETRKVIAYMKPEVRRFNAVRNEKCPCGSGRKFKNCCHSGKQ